MILKLAPGRRQPKRHAQAAGTLRLDPPGIDIDIDAIYRDASIEPIG